MKTIVVVLQESDHPLLAGKQVGDEVTLDVSVVPDLVEQGLICALNEHVAGK